MFVVSSSGLLFFFLIKKYESVVNDSDFLTQTQSLFKMKVFVSHFLLLDLCEVM